MNTVFILISALVFFLLIFFFLLKKLSSDIVAKVKPSTELVEWLKTMTQQVDASTSKVDATLAQTMQQFNIRLDKAAFVIGQVQKNIGEFSEIGRSMRQLQELLKSPKLRGNIGETILKEVLTQSLPHELVQFQYSFKNGEKVDAVIHTSQGIIPIDAKFPMENFIKMQQTETQNEQDRLKKEFVKNVKKHIHDVSKKYILPQEKTLDYALLYIPTETIYYEVIKDEELFSYAASQQIVLVSPLSFYAYLKVILMSYQGQQIQEKAKIVLQLLSTLKKEYEKTDEAFMIFGKHFTNAHNQLQGFSRLFSSLGQTVSSSSLLNVNEKLSDVRVETNSS